MILELRFSNIFSILDEVVLDLQAAALSSKMARALIGNTFACGGERMLKTVAIYGANASGKSSVFKALNACLDIILHSHQFTETAKFPFTQFKFGGQGRETTFGIRMLIEGVEYEYSFAATDSRITREALYYYPKGRRSIIFEREWTQSSKRVDTYKFRTLISRPHDVAANTSGQTLYLTRGAQMGRAILQKVYRFFAENIVTRCRPYTPSTFTDITPDQKSTLLEILHTADSDITDFDVSEGGIFTVHRHNPSAVFDFKKEESDGTIRLFDIAWTVIDVLKHGKTLFIDEIESSLHTKLVEFIVNTFNQSDNAQLVFSSHNTYLLNLHTLRKDQIYFTRKTAEGATELYSLLDFKEFKEGDDLEAAYMQGLFDAIPYLAYDKML